MLSAIVAEIADALAPVPVLFGREHLQVHSSPPRVVFVPRSSTGSGARGIGRPVRRVATRQVTLDVHIWAASTDATEQLLNDVIVACRSGRVGSFRFNGESWPDENAEALTLGSAVVASVTFDVPVTETPSAQAEIKEVAADVIVAAVGVTP